MSTLVRSGRSHGDDAERLAERLSELEAALRERSGEVEQLKIDLTAFQVRYRQDVGLLHEELDELERDLAEAELGEIAGRVEDVPASPDAPLAGSGPEPAPQFTSDSVRRLFRDVARTIHPDLGSDDTARDRRHRLMIEANRAYALGDEQRLRSILEAWEKSPDAVQGSDPEATRLRLGRRIAQLEDQLLAYEAQLAELKGSPVWKLKTMVDEAAAGGNDLIADMVRRLQRDILVTRNRLDAITWRP